MLPRSCVRTHARTSTGDRGRRVGACLVTALAVTAAWLSAAPVQAGAFSLHEDPFEQQGEALTSPEVTELAAQGYSVALSANGDTALVGSPDYKESVSEEFAGAAWVYVRSGSTWVEQAKLVGSEGGKDAQQGRSVAISANGETALIGGPEDAGPGEEYYGAAWVFRRNGAKWEQVGKKLVAGGPGASSKAAQGSSVALSANGETALIGAEDNEEGGKSGVGAAFVFRWNGSEFKQQGGPLVGQHGSQIGLQGWSVALSGDGNTALIGGPKSEGEKGEKEAGAAWVFTWNGSEWKEQTRLPAGSGSGLESGQGESVALSGDGNTALVGGIGYANSIGAAWVYVRSGDTWAQQGQVLQGNGAGTLEADLEGSGVALSESGNTAVVGGYADNIYRGAAWAFERSGSSWSEQQKLEGVGHVGETEQGYGVAVSADGSTALVGAPATDGELGAAWVFHRSLPSAAGGGGEPEPKNEPQNSGPSSNGSGGGTSNNSSGGPVGSAAGSPGIATTPQAIEELRLGCSRHPLVLNDVLIHGSHVALEGSAAKSLVGKRVKIVFDGARQPVATATVAADGQFSTTAPLPPARLRDSNNARYTAESGGQRSLDLKLTRRVELEPPKFAAGTVTLVGQVVPPLAKPVASVAVQQQLECGKTTIVKRFTPSAGGRFRVTVAVPAAAKAGIYRLTSAVAVKPGSKRAFATYSLPLPVLFG
jgi:hypothetical protein